MWLEFLKLEEILTKVSPTLWFAHSSRLVLTKLPAGREEKEEKEKEEGEKEEEKEEQEEEEREEEWNESPPTYPGGLEARGCPTLSSLLLLLFSLAPSPTSTLTFLLFSLFSSTSSPHLQRLQCAIKFRAWMSHQLRSWCEFHRNWQKSSCTDWTLVPFFSPFFTLFTHLTIFLSQFCHHFKPSIFLTFGSNWFCKGDFTIQQKSLGLFAYTCWWGKGGI